MPLSDWSIITASADAISCDIEGEAVILNLKDGKYYGLNPTAAFVWRSLDRPRAVEELRQALLARFSVEPARCARELAALLDTLARAGIVTSEDNRGTAPHIEAER